MNYQFQKIVLDNAKIKKTAAKMLAPSDKKIAIVLHLFYMDIWDEVQGYLKHITEPYDLFVTVPDTYTDKALKTLFDLAPDMHLYMVENRGRDVLPFLQVMRIIPEDSYAYICKLHTKKTGDSPLGNVWRKLLYFDLLGSAQMVSKIIELFEENEDIGIITGRNVILDSQRYAYGNDYKIDYLAEKMNVLYSDHYFFPAGTMFWIRTSLLKPLVELFKEGSLEFEEEKGQKDDTLAHAIERFFGILAQDNEQGIVASPSSYKLLDEETIEALADLILQQQYAGVDMFVKQKHRIEELEALAESMRIKNRIKRVFPSNIKSKVSKVTALLKTIKHNPQVLKKAFYYLMRGDIAYLWSKTKQKSTKNISDSSVMDEVVPSQYFTRFDKEAYVLKDITVDIIIPVYNGFEFLEKLFNSIEAHTFSPYRLIVVNDASPDSRVKPYLQERLQNNKNSIFIDHESNVGFLKSVNEAVTYTKNHFVLLNTDTEVPSFWLERLMYPILSMDNVASTTPFTNSGEIASFPKFVADNPIFDHMDVEILDEAFKEVNASEFYEEVPTGVGFCMGVNYKVSQSVGMFAEETFGKGYGEENDWCQRAIKAGYKNLIVPNLFVYHKHGGSFSSEEKAKLLQENAAKLLHRHPNYSKDVHNYIIRDPHRVLRKLLVLKATDKKKGTYIIFDHDLGGGANIYADEIVDKYKTNRYNVLLIRYDFYSDTYKLFHRYKKEVYAFKITALDELKILLATLDIKELFINSLVSFKKSSALLTYLTNLSDELNTTLTIPIHDYYAVCPSYTLLNDEGKYCDVPSMEVCKKCMKNNTQEWRTFYNDTPYIEEWREKWFELLKRSQNILCFSNSSKEILLKAYPDLLEKHIKVIPHTVKSLPFVLREEKNSDVVTIGILGAINYAKGAELIRQLVQKIEREKLPINLVLIGEMSKSIKSKYFRSTGRYQRDDLPQIVSSEKIDIFLIPSIWPETFSYTTQEIMMLKMPLMVFNLGAPAERVREYEQGYIVEEISADAVLDVLKQIKDWK